MMIEKAVTIIRSSLYCFKRELTRGLSLTGNVCLLRQKPRREDGNCSSRDMCKIINEVAA